MLVKIEKSVRINNGSKPPSEGRASVLLEPGEYEVEEIENPWYPSKDMGKWIVLEETKKGMTHRGWEDLGVQITED